METGTLNDRTSVPKREGTRLATHQRLWWMELTRGIITFVSGCLFLTATSFAPRLFIYSLGGYLVIDGLLDLYGARKSKGASQPKPLEYAGGAASLLSGLFSLVLPTLALLLLAALIAVRLLLKSFSQMHTARRARSRSIALVIPSHIKGSPPPWRKPRWRAWEELTLVMEMMIGHVRTVCTSGMKLIAQHLRGGASQP